MEHAKKMVLISPENLKRMHNIKEDENITNQLDIDMRNVLKLKLSEYEKWKMYQEILQRYLYFQQQNRGPIKLLIDQEISTEPNLPAEIQDVYDDVEHIANVIPKSHREKARLLIQKVKQEKTISWNEKGVVAINNKQIPNSNISDLVGDIVRYKKNNNPTGWEDFLSALKVMNIPLELVNNPQRKKLFTSETKLETPVEKKVKVDKLFETNTNIARATKRKWKRFSWS